MNIAAFLMIKNQMEINKKCIYEFFPTPSYPQIMLDDDWLILGRSNYGIISSLTIQTNRAEHEGDDEMARWGQITQDYNTTLHHRRLNSVKTLTLNIVRNLVRKMINFKNIQGE